MVLAATLILLYEFCERFTFYGIKTVLVFYFLSRLDCDEDESTILFHIFLMLASIFSLVGAVVADKFWDSFHTICIFSALYAIGTVILTLGTIPSYHLPIWKATLVGLGLIAAGTGCIKPCVSDFGKDQFELPKEAVRLTIFFGLFHFAVRAGSMLSTAITPILRADYSCYGHIDCFYLPFALAAIMMILAFVILIAGNGEYKIKPPTDYMFNMSQCIVSAIEGYVEYRRTRPRKNLLDYAEPEVGQKVVSDTKLMLKILLLYIPLSFFWALYDQQGSRWTLQATRMNGELWGYTIKPDQMQLSNQLLILVLVPIFDFLIYPLLSIIRIKRPLQKIAVGGLLAALAFVYAASLEGRLHADEPALPNKTESWVSLYNVMHCHYFENLSLLDWEYGKIEVKPLQMWQHSFHNKKPYSVHGGFDFNTRDALEPEIRENCPYGIYDKTKAIPGKSMAYVFNGKTMEEFEDHYERGKSGNPVIRVMVNINRTEGNLFLRDSLNHEVSVTPRTTKPLTVASGNVSLFLDELSLYNMTVKSGGIYVLLGLGRRLKGFRFKFYELVEPFSIHILSQLPQYICITAAEVMLTMNVLEFSFTQAPKAIKSVLQVSWFLTSALGNMLVVVIVKMKFAETQYDEYMLFADIMLIDMLVFIILAMLFKNVGQGNDVDTSPPASPETPPQLPTRSSLMAPPRSRPPKTSPSGTSLPGRGTPPSSTRPGLSTT